MWKSINRKIKIIVAICLQVNLHLSYPNSDNPAGTLLVPILERDGRILAKRSCPRVYGKCYALPQQHQANMILDGLDDGCFLQKSTLGILQWWATPCETWRAFCWLTVHSPPLTIWDGELILSIVLWYQLVSQSQYLSMLPEGRQSHCKIARFGPIGDNEKYYLLGNVGFCHWEKVATYMLIDKYIHGMVY